MNQAIKSWDGKVWEQHVKSLVRLRHGYGNYTDVPDGHGGDFGIECFSHDGCAYQCYAPKEPLDAKALHEHIISKINDDIHKFKSNEVDLEKILKPTKISRWILVVPRHESAKSVQHCTKKSQEVLDSKLSYVAPEFRVLIQTEQEFAAELKQLVDSGIEKLALDTGNIDASAVDGWATSHDKLIQILETKIKKLKPQIPDDDIARLRDQFIRYYIAGQNALEKMRSSYPEMWESATKTKRQREDYLVIETQLADGEPISAFNKEKDALVAAFSKAMIGLDEASAKALAFEALSDWMLRCPLDF